MNEEEKKSVEFNDEMTLFITDLVSKADKCNEKSEKGANIHLDVGNDVVPVRVDDLPLLYLGCRLLPNIVNYLVNILPQFLYPYVVAYLQDLSSMRDDPVTINELYDFIKSLD